MSKDKEPKGPVQKGPEGLDARIDVTSEVGVASAQNPSIARTVHYVTGEGVHLAAIVTRVPLGAGTQAADLHVLPHRTHRGEWSAALNLGAIAYGAEMQPGTWHWPERE